MQGKKKFKPKLFVNFYLPDQIPDSNFYKVLKSKLDLSFIYKATRDIYSHTGRPSLDPVVFFKMLLVGYLENICSDRALERLFQLRLDLLFFIDHDLGDTIPDHSTICKTRQKIPKVIFEQVFQHILSLCVQQGLVKGTTQSIDSAYINANASLDRMTEIKTVDRDLLDYLADLRKQDLADNVTKEDLIKRATKNQKDLIGFTKSRKRKYTQQDGGKKHKKNKRRFFSSATHISTTDSDARVAKKSGKPRMLCYTSTISVDTLQNVITHVSAEHASNKDSIILLKQTKATIQNLNANGLQLKTLLADAGFSSGENYHTLENLNIDAYIPLHGTYQSHRDNFKYDGRRNAFICKEGQILYPRFTKNSDGRKQVAYTSSKKICDLCPLRVGCVNARGFKEITSTKYKREYERMKKKLKSMEGKRSYALRMQTVEPVFGSLQQYYGLKQINVRGIDRANKVMIMAAAAFNLKKWIKKLHFLLKTIETTLSAHTHSYVTRKIKMFKNINTFNLTCMNLKAKLIT